MAALEKNETVDIVALEKANGEQLQLSFVTELQAWVICSKNVTILVRDLQDLDNEHF